MYKNPVLGHGPIVGIVSFLVSQLQHFHWRFVLQPGKKSKEKDVEKMFKLNEGQRGRGPRVFPSLPLEWKSCLRSWQRGESRDGCYVVMQRHGIAQSSAWKFLIWSGNSPLRFFGSTQTRSCMEAHTQEPLLMAILISFSKYQWGFVLYNDSEWRPPTSLRSRSHIHTSAHAAIFRVMQY